METKSDFVIKAAPNPNLPGVTLVAAPPQESGFCFGCYLFNSCHDYDACDATAPDGYDNSKRAFCVEHGIIWVEAARPEANTYVDPEGNTYRAVHEVGCEGCAFDEGQVTVAGHFTDGCFHSPKCDAHSNDGKSIIWVKEVANAIP